MPLPQPTPTHSLSPEALHEKLLGEPFIQNVCRVFAEQPCEPVLVGGLIRDALLSGNIGHDFDFIVPSNALYSLADALALQLNGRVVPLDEDNGVLRVVFPGEAHYIDLAACQGDSIRIDLQRRDLSINAMALNLRTGEWLDPFDGQGDLAARRLKPISHENLLDDPLRMLRVFRFQALLPGSEADTETLAFIRDNASAINRVAVERSQYELQRLLSGPNAGDALLACEASGLLHALLPEANPEHLRLACQYFAGILAANQDNASLVYLAEAAFAALTKQGLLGLALLLQALPESSLNKLGSRFKWPKQLTQALTGLLTTTVSDIETDTDINDADNAHLALKAVYPLACALKNAPQATLAVSALFNGIKASEAFWTRENSLPVLLTGQDIQQHLGIRPGPMIGELLSTLRRAQRVGDITSQNDALQWLTRFAATYRNNAHSS